jgi:hypothetical protein
MAGHSTIHFGGRLVQPAAAAAAASSLLHQMKRKEKSVGRILSLGGTTGEFGTHLYTELNREQICTVLYRATVESMWSDQGPSEGGVQAFRQAVCSRSTQQGSRRSFSS